MNYTITYICAHEWEVLEKTVHHLLEGSWCIDKTKGSREGVSSINLVEYFLGMWNETSVRFDPMIEHTVFRTKSCISILLFSNHPGESSGTVCGLDDPGSENLFNFLSNYITIRS